MLIAIILSCEIVVACLSSNDIYFSCDMDVCNVLRLYKIISDCSCVVELSRRVFLYSELSHSIQTPDVCFLVVRDSYSGLYFHVEI